jgi:DNA-binding PadR family transcriptional regulator
VKNADLAILGLIVEKPRYGYEIEQVIEVRNMRDWTEIGFSSIYHILNRLEKKNFLSAHLEASQGRGPARKVYQVTEEGRTAWYEATLQALSTPVKNERPFYLGMVGLPAVPGEEALKALETYSKKLIEHRDLVIAKRQEAGAGEGSFIVDAMFDYGLHLIDAEIDWIETFKQRLVDVD